jgi:hypothetical protein
LAKEVVSEEYELGENFMGLVSRVSSLSYQGNLHQIERHDE